MVSLKSGAKTFENVEDGLTTDGRRIPVYTVL